jgi:hypothetical protein
MWEQRTKRAVEIGSWNRLEICLKKKGELPVLRRSGRVDRGRSPQLVLLILPEDEWAN